VAVLEEIGINARIEYWVGPDRIDRDLESLTEYTRIRLCLPKSRASEVQKFLEKTPVSSGRQLATIWWDMDGMANDN
jgi:hypothetical protein